MKNWPQTRLTTVRSLSAALLLSLLGACAQTPSNSAATDPWDSTVAPPRPEAGVGGAIYRASYGMNLFVDRRARQIGDVITVILEERTDASKSSSTATAKDSDISIPGVTILGRDVTHNGVPLFPTSVSSEQDFSGQGSSSQSNRLTGSISVTVADVLPNGSLRVYGDKWVTINQGEEFIRIKGIIRPEDIGADNTVSSYKVADARITYSGKGALADANAQGWLSRIFQSVLSPF